MTPRAWLHRLLGIPTTRAIRGATTVPHDDPHQIAVAVTELVEELTEANALAPHEIVSAIFTVTTDLTSAFPAVAARAAGWEQVPLLCTTEIPVPDGMPRCIRVLLHVERAWGDRRPVPAYLRGAGALRPDLALAPSRPRESPAPAVRRSRPAA
ncbi:MAG: chorismate mutase [Gemmatimonadales bacterium]|nr:chorismate mutase [Gemmatimonadales bacterium]HRX17535.1 chorismate mutase [Gemmatimonadales bacterium]